MVHFRPIGIGHRVGSPEPRGRTTRTDALLAFGARIVAAVDEEGARELLDALTRPDRAALIGRLA